MTTITRGRLLKIQSWRETYGPSSNVVLSAEEAEALARIVLVSQDAKFVGWTDAEELRDVEKDGCGYLFTVTPHADPRRVGIKQAITGFVVEGQLDIAQLKQHAHLLRKKLQAAIAGLKS